jgi:pimeloyl-ACP methyl ester carboxylesterase
MTIPKALFLISILLLESCASFTHLGMQEYLLDDTERQKTVVIYLPGRGGSMEDVQREGILNILRVNKAPVDVVSVDAGLWFYMNRTLLQRIDSDVMPKIQADQYRTIWLLGNSMGGLGSLLYARNNPGVIKGIILLGPYLGDDPIIEEIAASGGLLQWTPRDVMSDDYQRDIWIYLKKCVQDNTGVYPSLFLLAGRDDRFFNAYQLLASAMAPSHVFWSDEGHDWNAWRSSFNAFATQTNLNLLFKPRIK